MSVRVVHCVTCGRHIDECGPLSARKRCDDCGRGRTEQAARQLIARRGPFYDNWRASMRKQAEETLAWLNEHGL